MTYAALEDQLITKIKTLDETVWERRLSRPQLDAWLNNFRPAQEDGGKERIHALYLLSQFIYFGASETRELLRAVYRDLFYQPLVSNLRSTHSLKLRDGARAGALFQRELLATRFVGVGNPSESGCHLLYYFRQENQLPKQLFADVHSALNELRSGVAPARASKCRRVVFLDDLCASGSQIMQYSRDVVSEIKTIDPAVEVWYFTLFLTEQAKARVEASTHFDRIDTIFHLDATFKCFAPDSRHFTPCPSSISPEFALDLARRYGNKLQPGHPLGFGGCQLLLGLSHNVPDNTLPIIWFEDREHSWQSAFPRYPKNYG